MKRDLMGERTHVSDPSVTAKPHIKPNRDFVDGPLNITCAKAEPRALVKNRRFDNW
jgi:hypothetical protein